MTERITLTRPDDWHLHVRDGAVLAQTVPATAKQMQRAIIMPNLQPPVMNAEQALAYRERILAARPQGSTFDPLMVLYLTDNTTPEMIAEARKAGHIHAVKLYPAGATTNSASGVTDLGKLDDIASALAENAMPLLVHGEVTQADIDIFDREKTFLDKILAPLVARQRQLKVVVEHITTADAADFVQSQGPNIAATLTVQHLAYNRNHLLVGGVHPHLYCLPVLKRNTHQKALQEAAISGNPKFFLGTDSAPHAKGKKENACGCAGCFSAYAAIELYAEVFEDLGALDKLEAFASFYGADFFGQETIVPLRAGETLRWQLEQ